MGSYFGLVIKKYDVISGKSYLSPEIGILFSEREKQTAVEDDGEYIKYYYKSTAGKILQRLSLIGITPQKAKKEFYLFKKLQINEQTEDGEFWGDKTIKTITFPQWCKTMKEIIENETFYCRWNVDEQNNPLYNYILENDDFLYGFPTNDYRKTLSVILSLFDPSEEIILDHSSLIYGGYYDESAKMVEISRKTLKESKYSNENIILLTEGTFDTFVLKESLKLLYPDLLDYFSFLDFENSKTPGGAGQLVNYIRALSGANVTDKILALFDNDSAAYDALRVITPQSLPKNIRYSNYPDIKYLNSYPTIGPTGKSNMNINKSAASIEMYLGDNILYKNQKLYPIQWKGYIQSLDRYQGEAINKSEIQKTFKSQLKLCRNDEKEVNKIDWSGIKYIWERIFDICKDFSI